MSAIDVFQAHGVEVESQITRYRAKLQVRNLLVGGVPARESVIRGWLRTRLELEDDALDQLVADTLKARGVTTLPQEELLDELMKAEDLVSVNGFKRNENDELVLECRCVKALLKEAMNSAYPGTDFPGKTNIAKGFRKGLMSTAAERVHVEGDYIPLGVKATEVSRDPEQGPAWIEERVKHVQTPQGPKSAIARVEVIRRPTLEFLVKVHDDFLPQEAWARIWERAEDIGVGSDRGRTDGQFDLLEWERVN